MLMVRLRRWRAALPATAAHAFAEFLALLGRHLFPAPLHLASPAEPAAPRPESSEEEAPQDHQSYGLPEGDGVKPEQPRHQIVPQMRDHETEDREGHDFQNPENPSSSHVHSPHLPTKSS